LNNFLERRNRCRQILFLRREKSMAFVQLLVFSDGSKIDWPHAIKTFSDLMQLLSQFIFRRQQLRLALRWRPTRFYFG